MPLFGEPNVYKLKLKRDVKGLIKALNYKKKEGVRRDAAEALGEIGDTQAVAPLIASLEDISLIVQVECVASLERIGELNPSVTKSLDQGNISRNYEDTQKRAVEAWLKKSAKPGLIEMLINILGHEKREDLSKRIENILFEFGDKAVKVLIRSIADSQRDQLVKGSQKTIEKFIRIEEKATEILIRIGEKAIEPLLQEIGNFNKIPIYHAATEVLAKMGDIAIQPLIYNLGNENSNISDAATKALIDIGEGAVDPLITILETSERDDLRNRAAKILGGIACPRSELPLLNALLNDKAENVRSNAAKSLSRVASDHTVLKLKTIIDDKNTQENLRTSAQWILKNIHWDPSDPEASFNKYIKELIQIGRNVKKSADSSSGFLYLDNKREAKPDVRARQIGEIFNKQGGIEMMRRARVIVGEKLGNISARELDFCWAYIGLWAP